MTAVLEKYKVLVPRVSVLCDVVVLSQAWKKAHTYIRRHNWYSDTLELDCSAVDLDRKLQQWSSELAEERFETNPAWLVPAPKNGSWGFGSDYVGGWGAKLSSKDRPVLRPLAHLGIREQTVTTAAMLCLADCIESIQGNPSLPPEEALRKGVFSYGNRLYCRWTDDNTRAHFTWGNSTSYSRYFQDYQQFVERPTILARKIEAESSGESTVYIVKLDLSAFYDNVDIPRLVSKLKKAHSSYIKTNEDITPATKQFWSLLGQILKFKWGNEDQELKQMFRGSRLPDGLPQGLLASGFFANAYMLEFDKALGKVAQASDSFGEQGAIKVHDYCRYVDDLRVVVSVQNKSSKNELAVKDEVSAWVQELLDLTTNTPESNPRLLINAEKTVIEPYHSIGGDAGTAARMKLLQQQLSGPFDVATLQQVEAGLNGLMALAELGAGNNVSSLSESLPELASVVRPKLEVRDDTLTRFSALRLTKALRMRRSMTNLSEELDEGGTAKDALQHDFEVTARRLVAAWATNPSLVQILRYALDLFPSPDLLRPILQALKAKIETDGVPADEKRVAYYVVAELFRAGATETGQSGIADDAFNIGNLKEYRVVLGEFAEEIVSLDKGTPWYVLQQAAIFLAATQRKIADLPNIVTLWRYRTLHEFLDSKSINRELPFMEEIAVSLVGYQLNNSKKHYVDWFYKKFAQGRTKAEISEAFRLIAHSNHELLSLIVARGKGREAAQRKLMPEYLGAYLDYRWPDTPPPLKQGEWISYIKVITHPLGPFREENALLHLAKELAALPKKALSHPDTLTPSSLFLRCADWSRLKDPRQEHILEIKYQPDSVDSDPAYVTPTWCRKDLGWMYAFGRLLRAAASGQPDFTTRNWLISEETTDWYRGVRSTWQNRRMGMFHSSKALVGTNSAITPWFSELLLELLMWPGIANGTQLSKLDGIKAPTGFHELICERMRAQAIIYGSSSNIPVYRYPVDWPLRENRQLRIVLVQGLMPAQKDFETGLDGLEVPGYRERHRNHTAALLHLAYRHIKVRDSVLGGRTKPQVDLVIFPEFAIHVDDQDLMRSFSDATGAMLFYGLIGATAPGVTSPVNAARWLVPQRHSGRRSWVEVDQGKWHLTSEEEKFGVVRWRPYQVIIELRSQNERPFRISGAVCYDATDLALAADLKDESHMFVVAAMNKDVKTFDNMVSALRYHMYQHVLIANCGEYGGSTAQAPYFREHERLISHVHGGNQVAVSVFDVCVDDFGPQLNAAIDSEDRLGKTPPAGLNRR